VHQLDRRVIARNPGGATGPTFRASDQGRFARGAGGAVTGDALPFIANPRHSSSGHFPGRSRFGRVSASTGLPMIAHQDGATRSHQSPELLHQLDANREQLARSPRLNSNRQLRSAESDGRA
jgi:hypothetical protein